ncbi:unnamed protein product [Amoebophrya sp. A120]|nr:unnamed protein product [Amoebophrya sp. A120]|eukprot:GSA120T00017212001.1
MTQPTYDYVLFSPALISFVGYLLLLIANFLAIFWVRAKQEKAVKEMKINQKNKVDHDHLHDDELGKPGGGRIFASGEDEDGDGVAAAADKNSTTTSSSDGTTSIEHSPTAPSIQFYGRTKCWYGQTVLYFLYGFYAYSQVLMLCLCYSIMNARELSTFLDFMAQFPAGNPNLQGLSNGFLGMNLCVDHSEYPNTGDNLPNTVNFYPLEPTTCEGELLSDSAVYYRHIEVMNYYWVLTLASLLFWLYYGKMMRNLLLWKPCALEQCKSVLVWDKKTTTTTGQQRDNVENYATMKNKKKKKPVADFFNFYEQTKIVKVHVATPEFGGVVSAPAGSRAAAASASPAEVVGTTSTSSATTVGHDFLEEQVGNNQKQDNYSGTVYYITHDSTRFVYDHEKKNFVDPQDYGTDMFWVRDLYKEETALRQFEGAGFTFHTTPATTSLKQKVFGKNVLAAIEDRKSWGQHFSKNLLTLPMVITLLGNYYVFLNLILPAMFFQIVIAFYFAISSACTDFKEQEQIYQLLGHSMDGQFVTMKRAFYAAGTSKNESRKNFYDHEQQVEVTDLLPGDVFVLPDKNKENKPFTIPVDCVLLTGSCSVNEASLTGEAVAIQKFSVEEAVLENVTEKQSGVNLITEKAKKKYMLFSGVSVLECGQAKENLCLVLKTGAATKKGELIKMLNSEASGNSSEKVFNIENDSGNLMLLLFVITFVGITPYMLQLILQGTFVQQRAIVIFRIISNFVTLLSPILLSAMQEASRVGCKALNQRLVNARNPKNLPVAGALTVQCFDKTGTITKDGLELEECELKMLIKNDENLLEEDNKNATYAEKMDQQAAQGVVVDTTNTTTTNLLVGQEHDQQQELLHKTSNADPTMLLHTALSTCHTVSKLQDGTLVGNQVELEMLKMAMEKIPGLSFSKTEDLTDGSGSCTDYYCHDEESSFGGQEHHLPTAHPVHKQRRFCRTVRQFEFDQHAQLQSCLVEMEGDKNHSTNTKKNYAVDQHDIKQKPTILFVKGSVKRIVAKCRPESVPAGFEQSAEQLAMEGFYLVAMAMKTDLVAHKDDKEDQQQPSVLDLYQVPREHLEQNLTLLGLLKFRNEIKPDSRHVIETLKNADIATQIITGDNVWAGVHIGRESGIIAAEKDLVLVLDLEHHHWHHSPGGGAGGGAVQQELLHQSCTSNHLLKLHLIKPEVATTCSNNKSEGLEELPLEDEMNEVEDLFQDGNKHWSYYEHGDDLSDKGDEAALLSSKLTLLSDYNGCGPHVDRGDELHYHWKTLPEQEQAEALFKEFLKQKTTFLLAQNKDKSAKSAVVDEKKKQIVTAFELKSGTVVKFVVTFDAFKKLLEVSEQNMDENAENGSSNGDKNANAGAEDYADMINHSSAAERDPEDPEAAPMSKSVDFWAMFVKAQMKNCNSKDFFSKSNNAAGKKGTTTVKQQEKELQQSFSLLSLLYPNIAVLGSMTPVGKVQAVEYWQKENLFGKQVIGMCGDGGNDSGAVNAADMGLVLGNDDAEELFAPWSPRAEVAGSSSSKNFLHEGAGRCEKDDKNTSPVQKIKTRSVFHAPTEEMDEDEVFDYHVNVDEVDVHHLSQGTHHVKDQDFHVHESFIPNTLQLGSQEILTTTSSHQKRSGGHQANYLKMRRTTVSMYEEEDLSSESSVDSSPEDDVGTNLTENKKRAKSVKKNSKQQNKLSKKKDKNAVKMSASEICLLSPFSAQTSSLRSLLYLIESGRMVMMNSFGTVKLFLAYGIARAFQSFELESVLSSRGEAQQMLDTFVVMFILSQAAIRNKVPTVFAGAGEYRSFILKKMGYYNNFGGVSVKSNGAKHQGALTPSTTDKSVVVLSKKQPETKIFALSVWVDIVFAQVTFIVFLFLFAFQAPKLFNWTEQTADLIPAAQQEALTTEERVYLADWLKFPLLQTAYDWWKIPGTYMELDQLNPFAFGLAATGDTMVQSTDLAGNFYNVVFYMLLFGCTVAYSLAGQFRAPVWKNVSLHLFFFLFLLPFMFLLGLFWSQTVVGSIFRVNIDNRWANVHTPYFHDVLGYLNVRFQQFPETDEMLGAKIWFAEQDWNEVGVLVEAEKKKTTEGQGAPLTPEQTDFYAKLESRLQSVQSVQDAIPAFWNTAAIQKDYDEVFGGSGAGNNYAPSPAPQADADQQPENYLYNLKFDFTKAFAWDDAKLAQLKQVWAPGQLLSADSSRYDMDFGLSNPFIRDLIFSFPPLGGGGAPAPASGGSSDDVDASKKAVLIGLYGALAVLPNAAEQELVLPLTQHSTFSKHVSIAGKKLMLEKQFADKWQIALSVLPLQLDRSSSASGSSTSSVDVYQPKVYQVGVKVDFAWTGAAASGPATSAVESQQTSAAEVKYMCQELCLASLQLQDGGDDGPFGRFMCWHVAMEYISYTGGANAPENNPSCVLFPRLDMDTKVALGPEFAAYKRDQIQRRRSLSEEEVEQYANSVAVGIVKPPSTGAAPAGNVHLPPDDGMNKKYRLFYTNRSSVLGWQPRSGLEVDRHNPGVSRDIGYAVWFSVLMGVLVGLLCVGRWVKDAWWK